MRKSLLLLLALTTCWLGSVSSNSVLNAASVAGVHEEQTQSYAQNLLAKGSVFGQFLANQLTVVNNAQNCDGLRVFNAVQNGCTNNQITWNIPISGDGEALLADFPRVVNTANNNVVGGVDPNNQPITLPVGVYEIQYRWDGDDECIIPVRVIDNQNPEFDTNTGCGVAYNNTVDADTCISRLVFGAMQVAIPTGTDNCPGATVTWSITDLYDGVITGTQAANVGGLLPDSIELGLGTTTVTFVITDQAATPRTATCTATVTVTDDNVPAYVDVNGTAVDTSNAGYVDYTTGNANAIGTDTLVCVGTFAINLPLAYDSCAGMVPVNYEILDNTAATISTGTGDIVDFEFPKGVNTVIVRATDGINATQTFSFLVEVIDDEAPNVVGCIEPFEVEFLTSNNGLDDCNAEAFFPEFLVSDNCNEVQTKFWIIADKDTTVVINDAVTNAPLQGTTYPIVANLEPDTFVIGYQAEDISGNLSEICWARFVVLDDEAPKRIGGAPTQDFSLDLNETDCDTTITITVPNVGDNSTGCAGTGVQGGFFQYYLLTNTATGDTVTLDTVGTGVNNVSELLAVGQYKVTWTAEDYSGNIAVIESFTVTIKDVKDPILVLPAYPFGGGLRDTLYLSNYPNNTVDGGCGVVHTLSAITVSDNCELASVTVNRGVYNPVNRTVTDTMSIGSNTFTYTATDTANNSVNTNATPINIVVKDDVAPTLNGAFAYPNIVEPVAIGQCSFTKTWNLLSFFRPADNCPSELDSLYVVVHNVLDPITPADTLVKSRTSSIGSAQTLAVTFDGPNNTFNVIVTAVDKSNNSVTKSFQVTATDQQAPKLFFQDTVTVFVNSNDCQSAYAEIIFDEQLVSDNCTRDEYLLENMTNTVGAFGDTVQGFFNISPTPYHSVTFTTMDSATANSVSKTVVIHVVDSIVPGIDLTPIDTIANDARVCEGTTKVFAPVATDACGIASVQYSINASTFMNLPQGEIEFPFTFPVGSSEIIWRVTDDNGNVSLDTQMVTVVDVEAPFIPVVQDIDLNTASGQCEQDVTIAFPAVTDNCELDSAYITVSDNNGVTTTGANESDLTVSIEPGTTYTGKVFASDIYGNRDSVEFEIKVEDIEAPTLNCPASLSLGVNSATCTADTILMNAFAFTPADNCSDFRLAAFAGNTNFDPTLSYSFPIGVTPVRLYIEDNNGNVDSCLFDVTVTNNIASHINGFPVDTVLSATTNECSKRYVWQEPTIQGNNCNGEVISYTQTSFPGEDFAIGETVVTYTFTREDSNGNVIETITRTFTIVVEDRQAPVITQVPADKVLNVGPNCTALLEYSDINFQDNCDAQGITITIADSLRSGSELPVGEYVVNIVVADSTGNSASASFNVSVRDITAPTLTVPANAVQVCGTNVDLSSLVSAADNCGNVSLAFSPSTLSIGSNTISVTASDAATPTANTTTKTFTVIASDSAIANITSPVSSIYCINSAKEFTAAAISAPATGRWSVTPTVNIANPTNATVNISFPNALTYTVSYTVNSGACGTSVSSQNVTVVNDIQATIAQDTITITDRDDVTLSANDVPGGAASWSVSEGSATISSPNSTTTNATGIENNVTFRWTVAIDGCITNFDEVVVVPVTGEQGALAERVETGFTPGGASNATWNLTEVMNDGNYNNGTIQVFNRWGNIVFESPVSAYPTNQWDGTNDGSELPTGSYYYVIDPATEGVSVLTGYVTIIR